MGPSMELDLIFNINKVVLFLAVFYGFFYQAQPFI